MGQPKRTASLEVGALAIAFFNRGLALLQDPSLSCNSHASFKEA